MKKKKWEQNGQYILEIMTFSYSFSGKDKILEKLKFHNLDLYIFTWRDLKEKINFNQSDFFFH